MTHLKNFLKAEILNCVAYEASKGAIAGTGAGLLVTAASNGLIAPVMQFYQLFRTKIRRWREGQDKEIYKE